MTGCDDRKKPCLLKLLFPFPFLSIYPSLSLSLSFFLRFLVFMFFGGEGCRKNSGCLGGSSKENEGNPGGGGAVQNITTVLEFGQQTSFLFTVVADYNYYTLFFFTYKNLLSEREPQKCPKFNKLKDKKRRRTLGILYKVI